VQRDAAVPGLDAFVSPVLHVHALSAFAVDFFRVAPVSLFLYGVLHELVSGIADDLLGECFQAGEKLVVRDLAGFLM